MPVSPTTINQDAIGHWISGFTDGEGHFSLASVAMKRHPELLVAKSGFIITLRADDFGILNTIQSYFQCGHVKYLPKAGSYYGSGGKPQYRFSVTKLESMADIIVPHFIKYPLRSKKASDFAIWQEGVLLHHRVASRGRGGCRANWTNEEVHEYAILAALLKDNRAYVDPPFVSHSALP